MPVPELPVAGSWEPPGAGTWAGQSTIVPPFSRAKGSSSVLTPAARTTTGPKRFGGTGIEYWAWPSGPAVAVADDNGAEGLLSSTSWSVTVEPGSTAPMSPVIAEGAQPKGSSRLTIAAGG